MRFGLVGGTYTAKSTAVADEECINFFAEAVESQSAFTRGSAYGGQTASGIRALLWTPGLKTFATLPESPVRAQWYTGSRHFAIGGTKFCEVASDGTVTVRGTVANDGLPGSIVASSIQILVVAGGRAYSFTLADNTFIEVTDKLAATPTKAEYSDGYGIVVLSGNKFQVSDPLDFTSWPGLQVSEISVFPEDLVSVCVNHREPWFFGARHTQPYQDTGSDAVFDVIQGTMLEVGCISPQSPCRIDNSIFWVGQDERGGMIAWRAQGYTPQRISTHAVEVALQSYANITQQASYSYQDGGHLFWVLYIPGAECTWVYDVTENLWHKRAAWSGGVYGPHWSQNHAYAFGKHLVGDWNSAKIYEMSQAYLDDDGTTIRRLRRPPVLSNEMRWIYMSQLVVDFAVGLGPQPPLLDGNGNPRPPQAMLQISRDRGNTWSSERIAGTGLAGQYTTRAVWFRLGRSRYPQFQIVVTDPIPWVIVDGYLEASGA
jgi:hypothetical protein